MGKYSHPLAAGEANTEKRGRRRLKAFLPVDILTEAGQGRGHILDITTVGARCHAHAAPLVHQDVTLAWNAIRASGHVIWVRGNGFGVLFHPPLTEEQIAILIEA
jgi:hypothetical protein